LTTDEFTAEDFIAHVNYLRERDPNFLEPLGPENRGQLHMDFSGGTYDMARLAAQMSGAYLFTDLRARWAFIEHDRAVQSAENKVWSPFAKTVQNTRLHYLNNLELKHALTLRQEKRLESVRSLMTSVWAKVRSDDPFSEENGLPAISRG